MIKIEKEINGNVAVMKLEGWLDTQTTAEFGKALDALESNIDELILDFEKLEYTSSAGLRQIVAAHKKMNGKLTVKNICSEIMDVFKMTGFDKRLHIE
ncbi:MAG: STAS domain-containing protein [Candidatus Riflebacteria bacterium]|jgi:anti-anti-sigma factor|nr:STAS domain-containing protein [Candidatus Riflebacteria bacterium]